MNRREFITGCSVSVAAAITGCKTPMSEDAMNKIAFAFGGTTGLVLDQCDIDDKSRNIIVDIVNRGYTVVPGEGQTILDAWRGVAKRHVAELVNAKTLTAIEGELVLAAFDLVLKGVQLLIERHPEVGTYGALTVAAIKGFCNGFLAVYKPVNANSETSDFCEDCTIDVKAFKALRHSAEARSIRLRKTAVIRSRR